MRRLVFATIAVFLALLAALLLALRSESFVLGAASWAVEAFTDQRLELRNPRIDIYRGIFDADEIHLLPAAGAGPALLSILKLSARLPLGEASGSSSIHAGALLIYVSDSDEAADPAPMQWLAYLRWLPTELRIDQVHLVTTSANTWIFPLKNLRGDRLETGNYRITADADYQGEPLGVELHVLAIDHGWGVTGAETRIKFSAPASGSEVSLAGKLEGSRDQFQYTFNLDAYYRDISEFLRGFDATPQDLAGTLRLHGTLAGDTSGFVLSDATFLLDNKPAYSFQAGGRLEYQLAGNSRIELVAVGELASPSYLVNWIDMDLGDLGQVISSIKLGGSLDKPVIEAFRLSSSNEAGLNITMDGQLDLYGEDAAGKNETNAIFVDMRGPSLGVLEHWLGKHPYDPGPWRASGYVSGNRQSISLRGLAVEAGAPGLPQLRATGDIGRITLPAGDQQKIVIDDVGLSLNAHVADSADLAAILGRSDIPPYHDITAAVKLAGTGDELHLTEGAVTITGSDVEISVAPITAVLHPSAERPLSDLAAPVHAELSDFAALSQYTSAAMPVLGPVQLSARLAQKDQVFQLLDLVARISEGDLDIQARGRIGNLATLDNVSLSSTIAGLDTLTLLGTLLPDFSYAGKLGSVGGSFKVTGKNGTWRISDLALASGDDKTPLELAVSGAIDDLSGLPIANLDSRFRVADPILLDSLTGMALHPVTGKLAVASAAGGIRGSLTAQIGSTRLEGDAFVTYQNDKIEDVKVALVTPDLQLNDFGLGRETENTTAQPASNPGKPGTLLARLREKATPFPVDVAVKIDGVTGDNTHIDSLQVHITGVDNRYTLEQFSASYNQALAEIRGIIDLNPDPPAMSLAGQATALPLSAILTDMGFKSSITGSLTVLGGLTVMGNDTEEMTGNLNGNLALALEDAVIEGAAYDVLATDLLGWIYSGALTEKSTHLDCTMAKFQLRQGVAPTDSLYIESAKMIATGKAEFDLVRRRLDVSITPLSKSRKLQVPAKIRLKGDMSNPKADISPIKAVADATSAALMLIPELTLKLFGIGQSEKGEYRPCQADLGS